MFSSSCNYSKLKTNLRLVVNRLKLLEKKKTELAMKARTEIADYIKINKDDRARIRVEHIIREDYTVEAFELVEMYCDLLLARFGLIQSTKEIDPGLEEAISSIVWSAPRIQAEVQEMKIVVDELRRKYGKEYIEACFADKLGTVNAKLKLKMGVEAPPKVLVERYMIEIAKSFNVPFTPDPIVMEPDGEIPTASNLIDLLGGPKGPPPPDGPPGGFGGGIYPGPPGGGSGGQLTNPGEIGFTSLGPSQPVSTNSGVTPPSLPDNAVPPPPPATGPVVAGGGTTGGTAPYPMPYIGDPPNYDESQAGPLPSKRGIGSSAPPVNTGEAPPTLPNLPTVPLDLPSAPSAPAATGPPPPADDLDFDDLTRRFEELKKKR